MEGKEFAGRFSTNRPLLNSLTSLRFVAAFSVFLHHLDALGLRPSNHIWNVNLGWTVSFFFVLSGFVLAYSKEDRIKSGSDAGRFVLERLVRLWPLHLACGLIFLTLFGSQGYGFLEIYLYATLQQSWIPTYGTAFTLNGVAWSISVELFFYLLFPALIILTTKHLIVVFASSIVGIAVSVSVLTIQDASVTIDAIADPLWYRSLDVTPASFLHLFPPLRLAEFVAGMLVYRLYSHRRLPITFVSLAQLLTVLLVIAYMRVHADIVGFIRVAISPAAFQVARQYGMFPLFALVVFVFAHQGGRVGRLLSARVLVFLGEISFSFYLIHQIVIRFLGSSLNLTTSLGAPQTAILALLMSVAAATLLHRFIEKPAMRAVKRRRTAEIYPRPAPLP